MFEVYGFQRYFMDHHKFINTNRDKWLESETAFFFASVLPVIVVSRRDG